MLLLESKAEETVSGQPERERGRKREREREREREKRERDYKLEGLEAREPSIIQLRSGGL